MKKSAPLRSPAPRPAAIALSVLAGILFLFFSLLCAANLAKKDARLDYAASQTPAGSVSAKKNTENDAVETLAKNGINFLPLDVLSEEIVPLSDQVFEAKIAGETVTVCVGQRDFFRSGKLGFLSEAPISENGRIYLPLPADISPSQLTADSARLAVLSVLSPDPSAPTLPENVSTGTYFEAITDSPRFSADLSDYEIYMAPADRDAYLVLANATHSLGAEFAPENLLEVERARYTDPAYKARLQEPAAKSLDAFLREAYAQGFSDVTVTSGYRSYADQEYRFNYKVSSIRDSYNTLEEAQEAAAKVIQWPGKSEHQTGLACDMHNLAAADTSFGDTEAAKWLHENAHYFGFILRYPEDKTEITGISYEPWHFRFVGRYHATRMYLLNLTLEEYVDFLEHTGSTV